MTFMPLSAACTHDRIGLTLQANKNKTSAQMTDNGSLLAYDDGLVSLEVGPWAEAKHRLVSLYSTYFSSGMKAKWSRRIYVELYAGAGFSRIRGTSKFLFGSPYCSLYG